MTKTEAHYYMHTQASWQILNNTLMWLSVYHVAYH